MAAKPPDAFLSYTRFNDQHDGGAISEFCRRLASAVQAVTGVPFEIFQDVGGIGIGEHWPDKLDRMLDQARFFIPMLTPSYFTSRPCREELDRFLRAEAQRGRNDLVLPIYYIESDVLEDEALRAADPLAKTLHERQRQDWRELRFESFEAGSVRRGLERLAREIVKARRRPMHQVDEEARKRGEEEARHKAEEEACPARATMIAGRNLTLVTERDESFEAFEAFKRAFADGAAKFPEHVVGFRGGHETVNVHWHESAGIWGRFVSEPLDQQRKPLGRFWIAFGVDDPRKYASLNITVEMNPPHEGGNGANKP